jgi:FkbM family methyltransferase
LAWTIPQITKEESTITGPTNLTTAEIDQFREALRKSSNLSSKKGEHIMFTRPKRLLTTIQSIFEKKKGTLVYVGLHKGSGFNSIFRRYETCYAFEANPDLYAKLKKRFKKYSNVHIFNFAVSDQDGEVDFNISNNGGASSSIGDFAKDWELYKSGSVRMVKTVRVPSINLYNFLKRQGVQLIDSYISDIQGIDLEVLKTLKPLLDQRKISSITCEVTKDKHRNIYENLPDNSESGFNQLLRDNYECVAKGWGILMDGAFNNVPESWWEMDCKWKVKN